VKGLLVIHGFIYILCNPSFHIQDMTGIEPEMDIWLSLVCTHWRLAVIFYCKLV